MNSEVYKNLIEEKHQNDISFPYWIYHLERVNISDKHFVKIFLFNRFDNDALLNFITVKIGDRSAEIKDFNIVSEYQDKNIVGCYAELEDSEVYLPVSISMEVVDGQVIQSSGLTEKIPLTPFPDFDDYLCSKREKYRNNHVIFPYIGEKVWQCSCGRIHNNDEKYCRCGQSLTENIETIHFDYKKHFEEDRRIEEEQQQIKEEENRKRQRKIKKISVVLAIAITGILGTVFFPKQYVKYMIYKQSNDLHEKYIKLWELNTDQSRIEADIAYRDRMVTLMNENNYADVVKMVKEDNQYTSLVNAVARKDGTVFYNYRDPYIEEMYIISQYCLADDFSEIRRHLLFANRSWSNKRNFDIVNPAYQF